VVLIDNNLHDQDKQHNLSPFYIPIIRIRAKNAKPYEVVLTMPMNHAILQLDFGDTCRRVSTVNHVRDISVVMTHGPTGRFDHLADKWSDHS
jgi:hypothetical protein